MFTFLIGLIAVGAALFFQMARPLNHLAHAMQAVSRRDGSVEVPYTKRDDEIGFMAHQLSAFQVDLMAAKNAQHEAAFKSGAFEGGSTAMMVVDDACVVQFANPACVNLLETLMPDLAEIWPGVAPDQLAGMHLGGFELLQDIIQSHLKSRTKRPFEGWQAPTTVQIGDRSIQIKIESALDIRGDSFARVIEWSDRTEFQHHAALINAINKDQLRIEFDLAGNVRDANEKFLELVQGSLVDIAASSLRDFFRGTLVADETGVSADL